MHFNMALALKTTPTGKRNTARYLKIDDDDDDDDEDDDHDHDDDNDEYDVSHSCSRN